MIKAYKYRIYPNKEQKILIAKHFGCHRWVYNWGLAKKIEVYKTTGKSISRFDLQKELPELKIQEDYKWLSEVTAQSLQISLDHLDKAFTRFFREKKGFPKFKKKCGRQSYQCFSNVRIDWNRGVKLPKLGFIKASFSRKFDGEIGTTTISKSATGKYYVSIIVKTEIKEPELRKIKKETSIGIDTGIKSFLTLSDGISYENNRYLKNSLQRLKVLQRRTSRCKKGSNRRRAANLKVAKLHEKVANQRHDHIHKITKQLTDENQVSAYCIESLNVQGMMSNHNLAQALSDVSIGEFYRILDYKCKWNGINLLKIGRFEPSSKTCCKCGNIKRDQTLGDRIYNCDKCGNIIDRDVNAAINIRDFALHPKNNSGEVLAGEDIE